MPDYTLAAVFVLGYVLGVLHATYTFLKNTKSVEWYRDR
jgi:hypothetical protein